MLLEDLVLRDGEYPVGLEDVMEVLEGEGFRYHEWCIVHTSNGRGPSPEEDREICHYAAVSWLTSVKPVGKCDWVKGLVVHVPKSYSVQPPYSS